MRFINAIVQWRWLTPRGGDFPGSHPQTWIWCTNKNTSLEKGIRLETRLEYHWIISLYFIVAFVSRELLIVACTLFLANSVPWFLCLNKGPRHGFQSYPMNTVFSNATRRCTPYYLVESLPGVTVPLAASMFFSSDLGIDYGKNRLMLTGWVFYCVYQKELL